MQFLKNNGLSVAFVVLFLICVGGHALSGHRVYNAEQKTHHEQEVSFPDYLKTGHFGETLAENWESEFLQMAIFVLLSSCLRQKGSAESKPMDEKSAKPYKTHGAPWPVRRGGMALKIYEHSLTLSLFLLFIFSFGYHAVAGLNHLNQTLLEHGEVAQSLGEYVTGPHFWFESFQNWQSEFLSVAALVWLSVFLRQKGSSQSKPVDAPHSQTGV